MTDEELIARLRLPDPCCEEHHTQNEAADRIEALVKEKDGFYEEAMHHIDLWGKALAENTKLEARLAKAVEALRFYAQKTVNNVVFSGGDDCGWRAEEALAVIGGEG